MTYFKQTCDKPYDRHHYKLVYDTKEIIVKQDAAVKFTQGIAGGFVGTGQHRASSRNVERVTGAALCLWRPA